MPIPTIIFGILLSTLYGAGFHFIRGGTRRRLLFCLILAWVGFWLGDTLGWYMNWTFASVGVLNAGMGTATALLFLIAGDFVSRIQINL